MHFIHFAKNSTFHCEIKHIDVRYHYLRVVLDEKFLELLKIYTDDHGSDIWPIFYQGVSLRLIVCVSWQSPPHSWEVMDPFLFGENSFFSFCLWGSQLSLLAIVRCVIFEAIGIQND